MSYHPHVSTQASAEILRYRIVLTLSELRMAYEARLTSRARSTNSSRQPISSSGFHRSSKRGLASTLQVIPPEERRSVSYLVLRTSYAMSRSVCRSCRTSKTAPGKSNNNRPLLLRVVSNPLVSLCPMLPGLQHLTRSRSEIINELCDFNRPNTSYIALNHEFQDTARR